MSQEQKKYISGESELLLEYARPDIYRKNAFRISGLSVLSTTAEIIRESKLIEMRSKFGSKDIQKESPFPLTPPPTQEEINNTLQKLKDPVKRIIDEFFWFWPYELEEGKNDEALKSLNKNDVNTAQRIWIEYENQMSVSNVSMHNLAVLSHLLALDCELNESTELTQKEKIRRDMDWKDAFKRWKVLLTHDGFWDRLADRIKLYNDPRLKTDTVSKMKDTLTVALLQINGILAVELAENNNDEEAKRHLNLIKTSGFDKFAIDKAIKRAIEPVKQRLKVICKSAEEEAEKNSRLAHIPAKRLIDSSSQLLRVFDILLLKDDPIREVVYDEVALSILTCQYKYRNKTEDYVTSLELLYGAEKIAKSEYNLKKIKDSIEKLIDTMKNDFKWCIDGYWDLPEDCILVLEKAREYDDKNDFDSAIELLSKSLIGAISLSSHKSLDKILRNCIAYCLKNKAIVEYNRAMDDYDGKFTEIYRSSLKYLELATSSYLLNQNNSYSYGSSIFCVSCGNTIYETNYYTRTFEGFKVPYHTRCSDELDRKFDKLKREFDLVKKSSVDLLVLADDLAPGIDAITRNLKIIRKAADERNIRADSPSNLKKKFNLFNYTDIIKSLSTNNSNEDSKLFESLGNIILSSGDSYRKRIYDLLFEAAFKDESSILKFFPFLFSIDIIKQEMICLFFEQKVNEEKQTKVLEYFIKLQEFQYLYAIINKLLTYNKSSRSQEIIIEKILVNFFESIYQLFNECDLNNITITVNKIIDLISPAYKLNPYLEQRLLCNLFELIKYPPQNLNGGLKRLEDEIKRELIAKSIRSDNFK